MKKIIALTAITVFTAVAPAWAKVIELEAAPGLTAPAVPATAPAVPATTPAKSKQSAPAPLSQEEIIRRQCAVARYQHDQLYKAGVPDADEQVNVRAACEPDKVESESVGKWVLIIVAVIAVVLFAPMLLMGMAPG